MTHDYKRNGTTDLFAALNVGTGEVLTATRRSHKATDVLAFVRWIDLHVDRDLEIHVVLDNLSAQSSWLNLVEGWFKLLTARRLRRRLGGHREAGQQLQRGGHHQRHVLIHHDGRSRSPSAGRARVHRLGGRLHPFAGRKRPGSAPRD